MESLTKGDKQRVLFLKACLKKLGLDVSEGDRLVPSLSSLHLTAISCASVASLVNSWKDIIAIHEDDDNLLLGEKDTFRLHGQPKVQKSLITSTLTDKGIEENVAEISLKEANNGEDTFQKSNANASEVSEQANVILDVIAHELELPVNKETPFFNHHVYYANLRLYGEGKQDDILFGQYLLYGEVVTSTSTMLEKLVSPKFSD